jgi:hypothetical protein
VLIEGKHKDAFMVRNLSRLLISSNENWVVPAGARARRWFVLDIADTHRNERAYFAAIEDELDNGGLGALMHHLMSFDLSAIDVFTAPKTKALLDQKEASADPRQMFWLDTLKQGYVRYMGEDTVSGRDKACDTNGWPPELLKEKLFSAYALWAKEHNVRSRLESSSGFHRWFKEKELLPGVTDYRPHGGQRTWSCPR